MALYIIWPVSLIGSKFFGNYFHFVLEYSPYGLSDQADRP